MRRPGGAVAQLATVGTAIAVSSALGYALLVVVGRSMSPEDYGIFIAFWGACFGLASSMSTIEQEVARRGASRDVTTPPSVGSLAASALVVAVAVGSLLLVPAVRDRVLGSATLVVPLVVVVAGAGFAVQFATRGLLIGRDRSRAFGGLVVAEAAVRLLALLVVVLVAPSLSPAVAAVCVGLGAFVWLLQPRTVAELATSVRVGQARSAGRRALTLMFAAALTAVLITGYPTLVTAVTGEAPGAAGGAAFAALTVSRVPLLLVSPLQAVTVPAVVRWRTTTPDGGSAMIRRLVLRGGAGLVAVAVLAAAAGWLLGPWAVRLLYGEAYDVPGVAVALLVGSACLLAGALLVSAALVGVGAHRPMTLMWLTALGGTVVWLALAPTGVVLTTAVGSLVGPVLALTVGTAGLLAKTAAERADRLPA